MTKVFIAVFIAALVCVVLVFDRKIQKNEELIEKINLKVERNHEEIIVLGNLLMTDKDEKSKKIIKGMESLPWYPEGGRSDWHESDRK